MKYKIKLLVLATVSLGIYSFTSLPTGAFQQLKTEQHPDSIKSVAHADSLKALKNMKFKVYKKNAHASYYHNKFNGRKTASGKRFDNNKYTAAHRSLPFGTKLRITNEVNHKW